MYIVKLINNGIETPIHDNKEKLHSGKVVKGINTIDSFTFSMLPSNAGFNLINEFTTLVTVYNTNKERYDFIGRVLFPETTMSESGLITKEVTCESILGYLCDSLQSYVNTKNWTVSGLLQHLIDCHNSQVEEYKRFKLGAVTATDPNDNLYLGIQRKNTWDEIEEKLIKKIGGELRYRVEDDGIYIDYMEKLGETRTTPIALSVNMKAITREKDPTAYVTRLIPLGSKLKDAEGNETEERVTIKSVNNGLEYIDDETAIAVYGIHVGCIEFDDVNVPTTLLTKGRAWMAENNKIQIKYSITALDLSLIGLAIDDLDVCDSHPIKNALLGIDDVARIIKKTIDVCEEVKSTIEMGDNFKTLSDIQREQAEQAVQNIQRIEQITNNLQTEVKETKNSVNELGNQIQGIDGLFFYIKYSAYSDGHIMTDAPQEDTLYMGTCSTNVATAPTDPTEYTWTRVRGMDGEDGTDGEDGENAVAFHIVSSSGYALKDGETTTLTAKLFDGTTEIDPNGQLDYTWYRRIDGGDYNAFAHGKIITVNEDMFSHNMDVYFVCGVEEETDNSAIAGVAVAGIAIVGKE